MNAARGAEMIQKTLLLLIFVVSSTATAEVKNGFHLDDALVPADMIQSGDRPGTAFRPYLGRVSCLPRKRTSSNERIASWALP